MSLTFCDRCNASVGHHRHVYRHKDGAVYCPDCQHEWNLARIEARRHQRPVATIVFAVVVLVAGGLLGHQVWRFVTQEPTPVAAKSADGGAGPQDGPAAPETPATNAVAPGGR